MKPRKRLFPIKNSSGFSLVQVMIALGLLSIIAMIYAQLSRSGIQGTKQAEQNLDMFQIVNEIGQIMSNSYNCYETVKEYENTDGIEKVKAIKKTGREGDLLERFKIDQTIGNSNLLIKSYSFSDQDAQVNMEKEGTSHLLVEFYRGDASKKGNIIKKIKLQYQFNEDEKVEGCFAVGYGRADAVVEIYEEDSDDNSQKYCNHVAKLRFNDSNNSLQICGSELVWYNVLMTCVPGTQVTCPSDETIIKTCNNLGTWSMANNNSCPDW